MLPRPVLLAAIVIALPTPALAGQPSGVLPLEKVFEQAAGLSLSEVVSASEHDARPSDGNLVVTLTLRHIQRSGDAPGRIDIVKAHGGLRPPDAVVLPDPYFPSPFKQGERYWFAWAGVHDTAHHRILRWWPDGNAQTPAKELEAAATDDRFAWSPQYLPALGVSYGRRVDAAQAITYVRVRKDGKMLWEKTMPGIPSNRYFGWNVGQKAGIPILSEVDAARDQWFLSVETSPRLPAGNEYGLPAGQYHVQQTLDILTGRTATVLVSRFQDPQVEVALVRKSLATGQTLYSRQSSQPGAGKGTQPARPARKSGH